MNGKHGCEYRQLRTPAGSFGWEAGTHAENYWGTAGYNAGRDKREHEITGLHIRGLPDNKKHAAEREASAGGRKATAPERLVFIGESGVNTGMTGKHARTAKERRAYGAAPASCGPPPPAAISPVRPGGPAVIPGNIPCGTVAAGGYGHYGQSFTT
jgi:hypothetical protein